VGYESVISVSLKKNYR